MSDRQEIRARRLPLNQRLLLNQTEAAEMLGVSRDTFRAEIAAELRPVRIGRSWHWPLAELERWIANHMLPADAD